MILVGVPCPQCKRPWGYRTQSWNALRWPDATWKPVPPRSHSLRYDKGPVPFIEVRRVGEESSTRLLQLGGVMLLDCHGDYEARAWYHSTDVSLCAIGTPASITHELFCTIDEHEKSTGELWASSGPIACPFGTAATVVLDLPLTTGAWGSLYDCVSAYSIASGAVSFTVTMMPEQRAAGAAANVGAPASANHSYSAYGGAWACYNFGAEGNFALLPTTNRLPYTTARLRVQLTTTGTGGDATVHWVLHGRMQP